MSRADIAPSPTSPKLNGIVLWYNAEKGHGFLKVEGRESDLHVHVSRLTQSGIHQPLVPNQRVRCRIGQDRMNRDTAFNIELVDAQAAVA